jgi:hypothetical protein
MRVPSVADLIPMDLNKGLPNMFVSKGSSFKLSS